MTDKALTLVKQYINAHLEFPADYALYVISQATILGNFKCLIACTLQFGMLFDLTFDAEKRRWYVNVYKKIVSRELDAPEVPHAVSEQQNP